MPERTPWPAQPTYDGCAKCVQQTLRVDCWPHLYPLATHVERIASRDRVLGFNWFIRCSQTTLEPASKPLQTHNISGPVESPMSFHVRFQRGKAQKHIQQISPLCRGERLWILRRILRPNQIMRGTMASSRSYPMHLHLPAHEQRQMQRVSSGPRLPRLHPPRARVTVVQSRGGRNLSPGASKGVSIAHGVDAYPVPK